MQRFKVQLFFNELVGHRPDDYEVEAETPEEAIEKAAESWEEDDYVRHDFDDVSGPTYVESIKNLDTEESVPVPLKWRYRGIMLEDDPLYDAARFLLANWEKNLTEAVQRLQAAVRAVEE